MGNKSSLSLFFIPPSFRRHLMRMPSFAMTRLVLLVLMATLVIGAFSKAYAIALLSEEFQLHIPWVPLQGRIFSVDMTYTPCENAACLTVSNVAERTSQPPDGAATQVNLTDLTLHIPNVSFQGNLYSVNLKYFPFGNVPGFMVTGGSPAPSPAGRGKIIAVTPLSTKTKEEITAAYFLLGFTASYGVSMNKVTYATVDPFGKLTQASGLLAIPVGMKSAAPLASYQHGTIVERSEAPTALNGYDSAILTLMAASGYVVVDPDYLGFGDSSGLHPYVHAKSLAGTVIDIIRAARAYCAQNGIGLNGQLFLGGYSEGGYATMATHKEMETNYPEEFVVTASAPAAGSYDLSGTTLKRFLSGAPYEEPFYVPYFLLAYNSIYGLVDSFDDLFAAPYDVTVPPLFDGNHAAQDINNVLPSIPEKMFSPQLTEALEGPGPSIFKTALFENDVYRWSPRAPMRLYHCSGDQLVPYENSVTAYNYFVGHGAPDVTLVPLNYGTHEDCSIPAYFLIKNWFDSLVLP